jgi:hypothetical protein
MAKRRRHPWSVLGIDKTDNLRTIKIAFASKLKVTRPDEDSAAFQRLVTARDAALIQANRTSRFDLGNVESHKGGGPRKSLKETKSEASKTIELLEFDTGEPEFEGYDCLSDDGKDRNTKVISDFLNPNNEHPSFSGVEEALQTVKALGIGERLSIEHELLILVDRYLSAVETDPVLNKLFTSGNSLLWNERKQVVLALNADFGWTENDRRLAESYLLDGQALADQLQHLKNPHLRKQTVKVETIAGWRRYIGYVVLSYFGFILLRLLIRQMDRWIN